MSETILTSPTDSPDICQFFHCIVFIYSATTQANEALPFDRQLGQQLKGTLELFFLSHSFKELDHPTNN